METLTGGCHCGRLTLALVRSLDLAGIAPRACDCSFCRKHGASYISDPEGTLKITARSRDDLHKYRQGSQLADLILCRECGVLVGVIYDSGSRLYGTVNAGCLDGDAKLAAPVTASPQMLSPDEKVQRWKKLWVGDVTVSTISGESLR